MLRHLTEYVPPWYDIIGIQPWEDKYEEMAKAMGIDPTVILFINLRSLVFIYYLFRPRSMYPSSPLIKRYEFMQNKVYMPPQLLTIM